LLLIAASLCLVGCAHKQPLLAEGSKYFEGDMPADFTGFWARDYTRSDNINQVLRNAYFELGKKSSRGGPAGAMASERDRLLLMPLARLVELITRPDQLTISQTEHEILVERKDDFALLCAFFDGVAKPTVSDLGKETCGWDDKRLISLNELPDGLRIVNRFEMSEDREHLRVVTTASSPTSPMPFTLNHYYWRIRKNPGRFECIETLSMKRVCSTGKLSP